MSDDLREFKRLLDEYTDLSCLVRHDERMASHGFDNGMFAIIRLEKQHDALTALTKHYLSRAAHGES